MNILVAIPRDNKEIFDTFIRPKTLERIMSLGNVTLNESDKNFTHQELCEKIKGIEILPAKNVYDILKFLKPKAE